MLFRSLIVCVALVLFSCKREAPLTWNADWSAPLAQGSLNIRDVIPDSLLNIQPDSSIILKFKSDLYELRISEVVGFQDTTFVDTFAIPLTTTVDFSPGQTFINEPEENIIDIEGAELSSLKIRSGFLNYTLYSTVEGDVDYTYQIQSAIDADGQFFSELVTVPAAVGNNTQVSGSFDLSGYTLDLTGVSGVSTNTILTNINCAVNSQYGADVSVSNQDTLYIQNSLNGIVIEEAHGYFGSHNITEEDAFQDFTDFSTIQSGTINIENIDVKLTVENGLGVEAFMEVGELTGFNTNGQSVSLNCDFIGDNQVLNRAYVSGGEVFPFIIDYDLNESNSNIEDFIGNIPSSLRYDFDAVVNPLGNISGFNDFVYDSNPLKITLDAEMPLSAIARDLVLEDTLLIDLSDTMGLNELDLMIDIVNGFPLSADIEMKILDQNDVAIASIFDPNELPSAPLSAYGVVNGISNSNHNIHLSGKDLQRIASYGKVVLKVLFDSPEGFDQIQLFSHYQMDYQVKANANVTISIE